MAPRRTKADHRKMWQPWRRMCNWRSWVLPHDFEAGHELHAGRLERANSICFQNAVGSRPGTLLKTRRSGRSARAMSNAQLVITAVVVEGRKQMRSRSRLRLPRNWVQHLAKRYETEGPRRLRATLTGPRSRPQKPSNTASRQGRPAVQDPDQSRL